MNTTSTKAVSKGTFMMNMDLGGIYVELGRKQIQAEGRA